MHAWVRRAFVLGAHERIICFENMSTCWRRFAKSYMSSGFQGHRSFSMRLFPLRAEALIPATMAWMMR